ncbi:hypothetical protein FB639_005169, partial [Coemansia asiatica]
RKVCTVPRAAHQGVPCAAQARRQHLSSCRDDAQGLAAALSRRWRCYGIHAARPVPPVSVGTAGRGADRHAAGQQLRQHNHAHVRRVPVLLERHSL